jgi:excisionase family DNA binding protein
MVVVDEQLLTVQQIAERLQVHQNTVLTWLKRGELSGIRIGGSKAGWRVRASELERFLSERETQRS